MKLSDDTKAEQLLRAAIAQEYGVMATLDQVRSDGVRELEWGEMMLAVPERIISLLELLYPDFTAPDGRTRSRAWRAFANSDMGKLFRTQNLRRRY